MRLLRYTTLALLVVLGITSAVLTAQGPFPAQIQAAFQQLGLWPFGSYADGDVPVWDATAQRFTPGAGGGGDTGNIDVRSYGATGDGHKVTDAVSTNASTTVTSATANFDSARDTGKVVWGARDTGGPNGVSLSIPVGTIVSVTNSTTIVVSVAAVASHTGIALIWGTDDTDALQAAFAAAFNAGSNTSPRPTIIVPAGIYIIDELLGDWRANTGLLGNPTIQGAGSRATQFVIKPDYDFGTTFGDGVIVATEYATTHYRGFAITGGSFNFGSGLRWAIELQGLDSSVEDVLIYKLQSTSGWDTGLFVNVCGSLDSGNRCVVRDVVLYALGGYGFRTASSAIEIQDFNYWELLNIEIGNGTDAVVLDSQFSDTAGLVIAGAANVRMFGTRVRFTLYVNGANTRAFCSGCVIDDTDSVTNQDGVSVGAGATFSFVGSRITSWGTGKYFVNAGAAYDLGGNTYVAATGSGGFTTAAPYGSSVPTAFTLVPTCNAGNEGQRNMVTDSNTTTWAATVAGSGANKVLAYCNGTNWTVAAR